MRSRGFSLIELMTVVAIAAIVLAIGVPALQGLVQGQRLSAAASSLYSSLSLARSEAIKRGARVDVLPADGSNWASGWTVYVDENGDGKLDADDTVVLVRPALPDGIVASTTFSQSNISYVGSGRTRTNNSAQAFLAGRVRLTAGGQGREVVVNALGRVRLCRTSGKSENC